MIAREDKKHENGAQAGAHGDKPPDMPFDDGVKIGLIVNLSGRHPLSLKWFFELKTV